MERAYAPTCVSICMRVRARAVCRDGHVHVRAEAEVVHIA